VWHGRAAHGLSAPALRCAKLGAFGRSEPGAGSDAASLRATAERKGDGYVINGSKTFITNGNIADYVIVAAYPGRTRRGAGISPFIVDRDTPGFTVQRKLSKTGHHTSETAALDFEER
jgi:alkylation response protein AidB-like acyl-CoA dehydrogenase